MAGKESVAAINAKLLHYRENVTSIITEDVKGENTSVLYTMGMVDPDFASRELEKLLQQIAESNSVHCRVGNRVCLPNGQVLIDVHGEELCSSYGCAIHHPSEHHMNKFSQVYNYEKKLMNRVCTHGVHHPDPDEKALHLRSKDGFDLSHSCCAHHCCQAPVLSQRQMLRGQLPEA